MNRIRTGRRAPTPSPTLDPSIMVTNKKQGGEGFSLRCGCLGDDQHPHTHLISSAHTQPRTPHRSGSPIHSHTHSAKNPRSRHTIQSAKQHSRVSSMTVHKSFSNQLVDRCAEALHRLPRMRISTGVFVCFVFVFGTLLSSLSSAERRLAAAARKEMDGGRKTASAALPLAQFPPLHNNTLSRNIPVTWSGRLPFALHVCSNAR